MLKTNSTALAVFAAAIAVVSLVLLLLNTGIALVVLTLLLSTLTYLFYRFNEKRLEEMRDAEAERRRHAEEMAQIHMNTIESLAIAIDAKDQTTQDRKSTRLNSSHSQISYAVFCLKKKKKKQN